jgi:uncharacterized protein YebE (UPF0316 family)
MDVLLWTFLIFFARVADVGLGTLRVQLIVRRKKILSALIGFVEILIFILIVSRVLQDIQYWPYVLAYASGFAAGTLLGMYLSEELTQPVLHTTVICHGAQDEIEAAVREAGFALTHYVGAGREGPVEVLDVVCSAQGLRRLTDIVSAIDSRAFLFTQEVASLRGGYVYGLKSKI